MKRSILLSLISFSLTAGAQSRLEKEIVKEINKFRVANGLDTVIYSAELSKASHHHARWMSRTGQRSHEETHGTGGLKTLVLPVDRFKEYRVFENSFHGTNENIAFAGECKNPVESAKDIVSAWSNSPGHRENMLETSSKRVQLIIGISAYREPGNKSKLGHAIVMNLGAKIK